MQDGDERRWNGDILLIHLSSCVQGQQHRRHFQVAAVLLAGDLVLFGLRIRGLVFLRQLIHHVFFEALFELADIHPSPNFVLVELHVGLAKPAPQVLV